MREREAEVMYVRRLIVAVVVVACGLALVVVGCGSSGAAGTTGSAGTADVAGLYPVSVEGKWGYIDKTGTIKIQPQFVGALDFSDGLATVLMVDGDVQKWGYVDTSGTTVIQPRFDAAWPFSEGLAAAGTGSSERARCGFLDKTGTVVIPMQYERASSPSWEFSEGLCKVMVQEGAQQRWGFIDKSGTVVIQAQFMGVSDFSEGLAAADSDSDAHGFIDKTGKWAIQLPPNLQIGGGQQAGFSEGLAIVEELVVDNAGAPPRVLQGYIDTTGKVVIEPRFDFANDFSEGLAAAAVGANGAAKWGFIDTKGAWVIQPQFVSAASFSEGLAAVATGSAEDARWSFIDKTGKVAIALRQNQQPVGPFSGGVAGLWDSTTDDHAPTAYIDITGKVIWQEK
jgi:hypothetical protein